MVIRKVAVAGASKDASSGNVISVTIDITKLP